MNKKSQVAVYILLGLVVLFGVGAIFHNAIFQALGWSGKDYWEVENYVSECLRQISEDGILGLGIKGGSFSPAKTIDAGFSNVSYTTNINQEMFKKELVDYVSSRVEKCYSNWSQFPQYNISTTGSLNVDVTLNMADTSVELKQNLIVIDGKKTKKFDLFTVSIPVRAKKLIETANKIIKDRRYNLDYLAETGFNVTVFTYSIKEQVVVLHDHHSSLKGRTYDFAFGVNLY